MPASSHPTTADRTPPVAGLLPAAERRLGDVPVGEEAAVACGRVPVTGRHRVDGPRQRVTWRLDRVMAAHLLLTAPPATTAFSLRFVDRVPGR